MYLSCYTCALCIPDGACTCTCMYICNPCECFGFMTSNVCVSQVSFTSSRKIYFIIMEVGENLYIGMRVSGLYQSTTTSVVNYTITWRDWETYLHYPPSLTPPPNLVAQCTGYEH